MDGKQEDERRKERERLRRMEREGKVKLGSGKIPDEFWESEGPEDPEGLVLKALIEDRREGR